jgi:small subunit ribosomal protein S7
MARRRAAKRRSILPDPKFGSELIAKFINHVMTRGKKSIATRIVYGALDVMVDKLGKVGHEVVSKEELVAEPKELVVFRKVLEKLYPTVEVRSRRVGGATYQVPVEIRPARRVTLAMRLLIEAAKARKEKTMDLRLANEMMDAMSGKGVAVKRLDDMHRMAEANRAFAHYRWDAD